MARTTRSSKNRKIKLMIKKNRLAILIGILCVVFMLVILFIPIDNREEQNNLSEYSSVNAICELATLKSYYHNVVMYEEEPEGGNKILNDVFLWPFGSIANVGHKQFWMEYSGIVETGIDANEIIIKGPNAKGIVEVYVPDARVLSVYADESSLTEPISENGWFTYIGGEEKAEAFSAAQKEMRQAAENDQALLRRAKDNAKLLLERYIINTGKELSKDYRITWIDKPAVQSEPNT